MATTMMGTMMTKPTIKVSVIAAAVDRMPLRSKRSRNGHVAMARTAAHASPGKKCRNIQIAANAAAATNRKRPIRCRDEVVPGSFTSGSIRHHVDDHAYRQGRNAHKFIENGVGNLADMKHIKQGGFDSPCKYAARQERSGSYHGKIGKKKLADKPDGCES